VTSKHGVAVKALAERHGWNVRAVYRDIEVLRDSGYRIEG
jgi:predicted DNA-binding transcriptional regulator YafY